VLATIRSSHHEAQKDLFQLVFLAAELDYGECLGGLTVGDADFQVTAPLCVASLAQGPVSTVSPSGPWTISNPSNTCAR
jgi:hypothetical protein